MNVNKKYFFNLIDELYKYLDRAESLNENEIKILKTLLDNELLSWLPLDNSKTKSFSQPFERLSINESVLDGINKRLFNISDLQYPPKHIAHKLDYNRASLKGNSFMYAGTMGTLCNSVEIQPKTGQLMTVSKWKMKEGKSLNLLVICQDKEMAQSSPDEIWNDYEKYSKFLRTIDKDTSDVVDKIYKFITTAFRRKVSPTRKQGYIVSALISDFFFKSRNIDALYYPTVPNKGAAMNIVIKPDIVDNVFELIEVNESICTSSPYGANQWFNYATGSSKSFEKNGKINWKDSIIEKGGIAEQLIKDFVIT